MSRKSRRKTLSHAEIENFLCDLNDDEPEVIKRSLSCEVVNVVPEASSTSLSSSSDIENEQTENCDDNNSSQQLQLQLQQKEDEDRKYRATVIRAFYKDFSTMRPTDCNSPNMNAYAKIIHQVSDYPLLPTRQIFPENYQYSITSLESKKALLMSMQPMLSAAEKQKRVDSDELEKFTRCKVGKSRVRSSTYEYLDFDTNMRISGKEYSRRYLLFLNKKKASQLTSSVQPATDTDSQTTSTSTSSTSLTKKNTSSTSNSTSLSFQTPSQRDTTDLLKRQKQKQVMVLQDIPINDSNTINSNITITTTAATDHSAKPFKPTQRASQPSSSASSSLAPAAASAGAVATSSDLDFLMSFDDDDEEDDEASCRVVKPAKTNNKPSSKIKSSSKSKRERRRPPSSPSSSRRRTLSPASTKAILQQEIEDNYSLVTTDTDSDTLDSDNHQMDTDTDTDTDTVNFLMDTQMDTHEVINDQSPPSPVGSSRKRSLLLQQQSGVDTEHDSTAVNPQKVQVIQSSTTDITSTSDSTSDVTTTATHLSTNMVCDIACDMHVTDPFAGLLSSCDSTTSSSAPLLTLPVQMEDDSSELMVVENARDRVEEHTEHHRVSEIPLQKEQLEEQRQVESAENNDDEDTESKTNILVEAIVEEEAVEVQSIMTSLHDTNTITSTTSGTSSSAQEPTSVSIPVPVSAISSAVSSSTSCTSPSPSLPSLDPEWEETRARERYEVRLEVAKWRYFWEVASVDAALAAQTHAHAEPETETEPKKRL